MNYDIKYLTDQIVQRSSAWLQKAKEIHEAVPYVEKTHQISVQLQTIFINCPSGISPETYEPVRRSLEEGNAQLASWMDRLPPNTIHCAATGSAHLYFAGTQAAAFLGEQTAIGDSTVVAWSEPGAKALEEIQTDDFTRRFILSKLALIRAGSEKEFEASINVFMQVKNGIGLPSSAGIELRNVLESLNGNLRELARTYSGNPAVKKWQDVALIIARGGPAGAEAPLLVSQESLYADLHGAKLTPIAKNDWVPTPTEWEGIYAKYVSFLYTVLSLIDLRPSPQQQQT